MRRFLTLFLFFTISAKSLWAQQKMPRDSFDIYVEKADFAKAVRFLDQLSGRLKQEKKYQAFTRNVLRQSQIYYRLNDSERAVSVVYNGLKFIESNNQPACTALLLRQLGIVYALREEFYLSTRKLNRAMSIAKKIKNDSLIDILCQSLFSAHFRSDSDSTLYYLRKTAEINKRKHTPEALFSTYNNYFGYYFYHDKTTSRKYLDSAIVQARLAKNKSNLKMSLRNLASMYVREKNFIQAATTYRQLIDIDPSDTLSMEISDVYRDFSTSLAKLGRYREAYAYSDRAINIRDTNYSIEMTSAVHDAETRYQLLRADEKNEADKRKAKSNQERERLFYVIVIAVALIALILFYFFYQNRILKQKNQLTHIESEARQRLLSATLDAREIERRQIASVLHDSISALLSSAGLQLTAFSAQKGQIDEISKTRQILKDAHDKVRDLSHDLVPTLLSKFGLTYALQDLCEKHTSNAISFEYSDDGNIGRYPEDFEMKLFFITSELLNNVLKHSQASHARLELSADATSISVSVVDDGIGFDGSKNVNEGFGITQIRARIASMNGKFIIDPKPGNGASVRFKVPLP